MWSCFTTEHLALTFKYQRADGADGAAVCESGLKISLSGFLWFKSPCSRFAEGHFQEQFLEIQLKVSQKHKRTLWLLKLYVVQAAIEVIHRKWKERKGSCSESSHEGVEQCSQVTVHGLSWISQFYIFIRCKLSKVSTTVRRNWISSLQETSSLLQLHAPHLIEDMTPDLLLFRFHDWFNQDESESNVVTEVISRDLC